MHDRTARPLLLRIMLVIIGAALALLGLAGLFLPVIPGWLLLLSGLAILAGEFVWARRILDRARHRLSELSRREG
jgi:uncharacterized membrane protein YbaN (DUF454 family)